MPPRFRFRRACDECHAVVRGNSKKTLQSAVYRHRREHHSGGAAVGRRRQQQASRLRAIRQSGDDDQPALDPDSVMIFVTCPQRREELWHRARAEVIKMGLPASCVRRRRGLDWSGYEASSRLRENAEYMHRYPVGLHKHTFLMHDFHNCFLPYVRNLFNASPTLAFVFWTEDDFFVKPGASIGHLLKAAAKRPQKVCWAGYVRVGGEPKWGAHFVCIPRMAVQPLLSLLAGMEADAIRAGDRFSYLLSLDGFLKLAMTAKAGAVVWATATSYAGQRSHPFKGRR